MLGREAQSFFETEDAGKACCRILAGEQEREAPTGAGATLAAGHLLLSGDQAREDLLASGGANCEPPCEVGATDRSRVAEVADVLARFGRELAPIRANQLAQGPL